MNAAKLHEISQLLKTIVSGCSKLQGVVFTSYQVPSNQIEHLRLASVEIEKAVEEARTNKTDEEKSAELLNDKALEEAIKATQYISAQCGREPSPWGPNRQRQIDTVIAALRAAQKEIDRKQAVIEKMNELHAKCMDGSCSCYSEIDGVCTHCNNSTRLSELAEKESAAMDSPVIPMNPPPLPLVRPPAGVDNAYPRCTYVLRAQGKPYPRTCQECGLGRCKANIDISLA